MQDVKARVLRGKEASSAGTHLQGFVTTTYEHLVDVFGEPSIYQDDSDTRMIEWVLETEHGVATVYVFDNTAATLDELRTWTLWHVGGLTEDVMRVVPLAILGAETASRRPLVSVDKQ